MTLPRYQPKPRLPQDNQNLAFRRDEGMTLQEEEEARRLNAIRPLPSDIINARMKSEVEEKSKDLNSLFPFTPLSHHQKHRVKEALKEMWLRGHSAAREIVEKEVES